MEERFERYHPDLDAYHRRARSGPCFVCAIVAGDPGFPGHPIVYEDEKVIGFLTTNPTQYGYALVCPKEHREQATGDFSMEEYLDLQRVVYRVAEAVREEVGAERMYVMTLGSNQGNSHVHWHVVPLPPGVPYEEQQFGALMLERAGALKIPEEENAALAERVGQRVERGQRQRFSWRSPEHQKTREAVYGSAHSRSVSLGSHQGFCCWRWAYSHTTSRSRSMYAGNRSWNPGRAGSSPR